MVNYESVPVLTTLNIYSEDSYFPYYEDYCYGGMSFRFLFIEGYGSATKLTKFTDWCSEGEVEYTNETGLETGRFYWVYEFEKSTKDYAGYIIFKA